MGSSTSKRRPQEESLGSLADPVGDNPFKRQRPLPLDRSVFWYPTDQVSEPHRASAFLRFIALGALREISQQVAARPNEGRLGFLIGELYVCPETKARYVVADGTVAAPHPIRGDRTLQAITLAWPRLQEQLNNKRKHLLGWYHTHPEQGLVLTASDVSAHLRYFPHPWQMALVFQPGPESPIGVVCRPGNGGSTGAAVLPFYELLEPQSLLAEGVRNPYFRWHKYRTDAAEEHHVEAPVVTPIALPEAHFDDDDGPAARVILPDELDDAFDAEANGQHRFPTRRGSLRRLRRQAVVAAVILAAGVALWKFVPWGRDSVVTPIQSTQTLSSTDPALARLDQLADEVARTVSGYGERARLFDNRQMTCTDLARGMVQVDEGWTAYNVEGRSKAGTLDPTRAERDEALYAEVQEAERHFRASGCPAL